MAPVVALILTLASQAPPCMDLVQQCSEALTKTASAALYYRDVAHTQYNNAIVWERRAAVCSVELEAERRKQGVAAPMLRPVAPLELGVGLPAWTVIAGGALIGAIGLGLGIWAGIAID